VSIDIRAAASADDLDADYVRHAFKLRSGAAGDWHFAEETVEVVRGGEVLHAIVRKGDDIEVTPERQRLRSILPTASVMVLTAQLRELGTKTTPLRHVRRYRLNPDLMRQPALVETTRLEETGQNIASAVRSLAHAGSSAELTLRLAKILPGLVDLKTELIGRHLVLKFLQRQDGDNVAEFNATEMSDGALRALGILVAALQMRHHELLIVEEPEVAVHIGAASFLYGVLREAADKGAVLLTTHSADLLDAARDEEILVCEYAQGVTKVGPLDEKQREIVREGLFSLAELMRSEPLRMA
jgi:type I restriction enzyme M protein